MKKITTSCRDCIFSSFIYYNDTCSLLDKDTGDVKRNEVLDECPLKEGDMIISLNPPKTEDFPDQDKLIRKVIELFKGTKYGVVCGEHEEHEYDGILTKDDIIAILNLEDGQAYDDYYMEQFNKEFVLDSFKERESIEDPVIRQEYIEIYEILKKGL